MAKGRKPIDFSQLAPSTQKHKGRYAERVQIDYLTEIPAHPEFFNPDERGIWYTVCAEMVADRTLAQKHLHAVEAYCRSLAMLRDLHAQIGGSYTVTEETKYGLVTKPNPLFALYQKTEAEFRLLAVELGRTPRTGAGIKSGEKPDSGKPADPFERLMQGLPGREKMVN